MRAIYRAIVILLLIYDIVILGVAVIVLFPSVVIQSLMVSDSISEIYRFRLERFKGLFK